MEMENDDLDFIDEVYHQDDINESINLENEQDELDPINSNENLTTDDNISDSLESTPEKDFVSVLLESRGINDKSKIKFENEDGNLEELDWDSLSNEDKLNILYSTENNVESNLDEAEIQLINTIRSSNLSPDEYILAVQQQSINQYMQQNNNFTYKVDDYSDDDLYVSDLISRMPNITNEEALEALDRAKQNEALFAKLIEAMRAEYKKMEDENIQYEEFRKQQNAQEQYNKFAENIEVSINNFTDLAGGKLDMDNEDMQELYDFITGFDSAGNSYFGKALNDPDTLVKMAWFALNGEDTIREIEDYYNKEITKAREEGYKNGLRKAKDSPQVVYKEQQKVNLSEIFDDLDDL